jgi:hypothetical protein
MERGAGDGWAWTAIDADSKTIISYTLGDRDSGTAYAFLQDVASRIGFTSLALLGAVNKREGVKRVYLVFPGFPHLPHGVLTAIHRLALVSKEPCFALNQRTE